jgi:hypothetical protein
MLSVAIESSRRVPAGSGGGSMKDFRGKGFHRRGFVTLPPFNNSRHIVRSPFGPLYGGGIIPHTSR